MATFYRCKHASEIRADLQRLKRDVDSGRSARAVSAATHRSQVAVAPAEAKRSVWKIAVPVVALLAALIAGGF
jgi:hypothetical protein